MTPIKTARLMRGMAQVELAQKLGITPQNLNQYENGTKTPGPKLLPLVAQVLDVSAAYIRGNAQRLAVRDFVTKEMVTCPIISETVIDSYGMYYLVEHEDVGPIAVILADGVQFTLGDWQGEQPMERSEIGDYAWVDAAGRDAVMLDGLPHLIWG